MNDDFNLKPDTIERGAHPASDSNGNGELASCLAERDSWKEKYVRVQADLDNFSKRIEKERLQWRNTVQAALLLDILPIVDDFDRAFEQKVESQDIQSWLAGFEMIRKSLQKLLEKYDVKEIPATLPFDPEYHEALVQVESPAHASGEIVGILQKGYTFRGEVLRPAKVSVAK